MRHWYQNRSEETERDGETRASHKGDWNVPPLYSSDPEAESSELGGVLASSSSES